ncbi:MAG: SpoVG family protein [Planctomycetota bacterium]
MQISEIRIKLMEGSEDRLRAFCSITIDECFVIRDLKIIDGSSGPFVAMPSRKLSGHCHRCHHKNHLRANYCNHCGSKLKPNHSQLDSPQKLYADVAHPINSECRERIQAAVIKEFESELSRAQQPGYRSRYDDVFDDSFDDGDYQDSPPARASEANSNETKPGSAKSTGTQDNADAPLTGRAGERSSDLRLDASEKVRAPQSKSPRPETVSGDRRAGNDKSDGADPNDDDAFGAGVF